MENLKELLSKAFEPGSAAVDWCEYNYKVSPHIAEFFNTHIVKEIKQCIWFTSLLVAIVGISSVYFHATLSLVGQLLDEISILLAIVCGFGLLCPQKRIPNCFGNNRKKLLFALITACGLISTTCLIYPWINAFILMTLIVPIVFVLLEELKICSTPRINRLGGRGLMLLVTSVIVWIFDRLFCSCWIMLGIPYLHAFWHVLIAITTYYFIILFAFFRIKSEYNESCQVKYWPSDHREILVPYLVTRDAV
ncbi:Alkaline ceramidase-like protein [Dinothrombium tinctorium]|uniref:Alkaline ceramidase n=1 Tax=Dinothrombium tinctorium TaxID=1965070 RepID=A0A443QMM6_9ACAR|nr:Alkaline ceramidase-like protein [Dinothrombium tinctorium]